QVAEHIVAAGGKRLRPMLLLLAAAACGKRDAGGDGVGADAHQLAAVIEFIHTSTLLHDDVVDESDLRRGRSTANAVWGNAASVRVIERKTAVLFAAATRLGAVLAGADAATCEALHDYGLSLGYAFQIADDVLDYSADEAALGKHLGDDLAEGKATLPLIHAMANSDAPTRERLRAIIEQGEIDALPEAIAAIRMQGSLDYSRARAAEYAETAERALDDLEANPHVAALRGLVRYSINRDR